MALMFLIVKLLSLVWLVSSKVTLENSGFETQPTNLTTNTTSQFILLDTKTNVIPGWSFNGTIWYVTAGGNVSLPGNGHGLQLGPNGMINQTFKSDGSYDYVLTFTLAPSNPNCVNNSTAVNVSGPSASEVFFFKESLGTEMWQTYAYPLWSHENQKGLMSLQIQSFSTSNINNITCWPIVDTLLITEIERYSDHGLVNSGFEMGPTFLENSSQGVLLQAGSSYPFKSIKFPPQYWSILGIVKYIDSKHYAVPQGRGAVELVSGNPSGIVLDIIFLKHGHVTLAFMMGDASDSCVGDFTVFLNVAGMLWTFPISSAGVGSIESYSVMFEAKFSNTQSVPISFFTYNETRTSDHNVLCGPVIDSVVLRFSDGLHLKSHKHKGLVIFSIVLAVTLLFYL